MTVSMEDKRRLIEAVISSTSLSALDQQNIVSMIPGMDGGNGGSYFEKGKLMVELAGDAISEHLAIGPDQQIWVYENGVYSPAPDIVEHRTTQLLGNAWTRNRAAEIEANLRARHVLEQLPEVPDLEVINLANGVYHWSTGTFLDHKPDYKMTTQLAVSFDASATCPLFSAWLAKAVPADALQTTWEAIGYALLAGNPLQRAILLNGQRGTGKSTWLNVLEHMIGSANVSHVSLRDMTESRFRVAEMANKVANIMGDIDAKYLEDPSLFKAITGADRILVEQKYRNPFSVRIWATPLFSANAFWRSGDTTSAYLERFTVLSFPNDLRNSDPFFSEDALHAESAGIFNVAMGHLRDLMTRGDFDVHGSLAELRDEFHRETDVARRWLDDDSMISFHEAGSSLVRTKRSAVYTRYKNWSMENGYKPLASDKLYQRLESFGYKQKKDSDRFIEGIQLKDVSVDWSALH